MIPKKPLLLLKTRYEKIETARRSLQRLSAEAQRNAKQAIFAAQREESASAATQLASARALLLQGKKLTKTEPRLLSEGIWRAALEEYAEALVFIQLAAEKTTIDWQEDLIEDPSTMLGGLSDAVGELVRLAIRSATARDVPRVERIAVTAEQLVDFLTSIDMTGPLRAKGDQARGHLRRLEDLRYDMSRNA